MLPTKFDDIINHQADNIVYLFIRNELGNITQLRMQGCGGPYFEIRCDKKEE